MQQQPSNTDICTQVKQPTSLAQEITSSDRTVTPTNNHSKENNTMSHSTNTNNQELILDPFATDPTTRVNNWTDEPLIPLDPEFNQHFQLQVDKNELQGMRNFIKDFMESKHLDEHQATLTRMLGLENSNTPDLAASHPYLPSLSKLLGIYGAPGLLEGVRLTREERKRTIEDVSDYPHLKYDLPNGGTIFGKELKRLAQLDSIYQQCGFSPLKDSFHDVNVAYTNVTRSHGFGDYAIVTRGKNSELKFLIETKNTTKAMGTEFFSEIHSQEQRAIGQNYQYGFVIVWPESESLAEEYLAFNGISLVEFNKQYRLWKDRFYCRKVRMPDEVFVAPIHYQDDPIGLFRSRMTHMANAIRMICNKVCRELIH